MDIEPKVGSIVRYTIEPKVTEVYTKSELLAM